MPQRDILLVDDEPYVTALVSLRLKRAGDHVRVASDGKEALAMAFQCVPQVIVSDFQMPVMNGFEMARALKADPRTAHVPVILLTARGHLLSPSELASTNIKLMLPKPFSTRELLTTIDELATSSNLAA